MRLIALDEGTSSDLEDPKGFERRHGVLLGSHLGTVREVVGQTLSLYAARPRPGEWGGFLAADEGDRRVIGTCAFVDAPSTDGEVEIAYFTFPEFEGRGYATAMAGRLAAIAASSEAVKAILAHTLPERNASTRILEKNGFRFDGEIEHPEDGRVWRWRRPLEP